MIVAQFDSTSFSCPTCGMIFDEPHWNCEPLPCPFQQQTSLHCAIVVKPTRGSFLEYKSGEDLHIGISDSRSAVHSFWVNGISSEDTNWDESVVICQFSNDGNKFDRSLSSFVGCCSGKFVAQLYDDRTWNCFDFVIEFMRFTDFQNLTKEEFVSAFAPPLMRGSHLMGQNEEFVGNELFEWEEVLTRFLLHFNFFWL
ncbi:hypothetical protein RB195_017651 [Necator americanus]|uniref:MKRN2 opposite strand protein-like C-terminal domain-containing protein n=1 Tax=Necator americanus TaxID=51031 RepID=A0ABR1C8H8_NECAM